jgi:ATP-dependent DNA helicase RecQ
MNSIHSILKQYWGYDHFRPGQEEIIHAVLNGHDTLALLPTGGGKSICFQVPALCRNGLCLVISPLIALMRDQVSNLNARGIKAIAIHTGLHPIEIDRLLNSAVFGDVKFLYVSPERLGTDEFKSRVKDMNINLIAIDEAHCISQWGYDFRPSYLKIAALRELVPDVPVIALTATATVPVVEDIQLKLLFKNGRVFQGSFIRENLSYVIRKVEDKNSHLVDILKKVNGSAIVYVRNRRKTKDVADYLLRNRISAGYYHAGLDHEERSRKQTDWVKNKMRVMVCTNAFGMGIDKPDVRLVVHIEPADSLEAYFQEAGRAGRDGQRAYAIQLITDADDQELRDSKQKNVPSLVDVKEVYDLICGEFNISYNTGQWHQFDFDLSLFSKKYDVSPVKVMHILKLLESQELMSVNETFLSQPKVKITVGKDVLYKFLVEHRSYEPFIKMILRTCSGVFEDFVSFNEATLGSKVKLTPAESQSMLLKLNSLDILSYIPRKEKPQLTMLQHRIKKEELILDRKFIEERIAGMNERIDSVRNYLANSTVCLSKYLVAYFGEKDATDCGICSVCIGRKKIAISNAEFEMVMGKIVALLDVPMTMAASAEAIQVDIDKVREVIAWLIDHGKIARTEDGRIFNKL